MDHAQKTSAWYTGTRTKTTNTVEKSNVAQCVLTTRTNNTRGLAGQKYMCQRANRIVIVIVQTTLGVSVDARQL